MAESLPTECDWVELLVFYGNDGKPSGYEGGSPITSFFDRLSEQASKGKPLSFKQLSIPTSSNPTPHTKNFNQRAIFNDSEQSNSGIQKNMGRARRRKIKETSYSKTRWRSFGKDIECPPSPTLSSSTQDVEEEITIEEETERLLKKGIQNVRRVQIPPSGIPFRTVSLGSTFYFSSFNFHNIQPPLCWESLRPTGICGDEKYFVHTYIRKEYTTTCPNGRHIWNEYIIVIDCAELGSSNVGHRDQETIIRKTIEQIRKYKEVTEDPRLWLRGCYASEDKKQENRGRISNASDSNTRRRTPSSSPPPSCKSEFDETKRFEEESNIPFDYTPDCSYDSFIGTTNSHTKETFFEKVDNSSQDKETRQNCSEETQTKEGIGFSGTNTKCNILQTSFSRENRTEDNKALQLDTPTNIEKNTNDNERASCKPSSDPINLRGESRTVFEKDNTKTFGTNSEETESSTNLSRSSSSYIKINNVVSTTTTKSDPSISLSESRETCEKKNDLWVCSEGAPSSNVLSENSRSQTFGVRPNDNNTGSTLEGGRSGEHYGKHNQGEYNSTTSKRADICGIGGSECGAGKERSSPECVEKTSENPQNSVPWGDRPENKKQRDNAFVGPRILYCIERYSCGLERRIDFDNDMQWIDFIEGKKYIHMTICCPRDMFK